MVPHLFLIVNYESVLILHPYSFTKNGKKELVVCDLKLIIRKGVKTAYIVEQSVLLTLN